MAGPEIAAVAFVVAASAWIQGSVGFGYALVAVPLVALVSQGLVPGPIMVSSFALSLAAALRERSSVDRRGVVIALIGRVPGALVAALVLVSLAEPTLNLVFGSLVLIAVAISASGFHVRPSTPALLVAGFTSGLMGTLTSIGGPPMAIVYQHSEGPTLRSTLNTYFALGSVLSISVLVCAGRFHRRELVSGLALMLPMAVGFALSSKTRHKLDQGHTRRAVLAVASLSSLALVLKTALE
jgi:uncharacterized membrane protein YfcA